MNLSSDVVRAFEVSGKPVRLQGGEGNSYLVGNVVFKPIISEDETNWRCQLFQNITLNGFRVPSPIQTKDGAWSYEGWEASLFLEGEEVKGRWKEKLNVSSKFHNAVRSVQKPDFIEKATHPWAVADRMIWGQQKLTYGEKLERVMKPLLEMMKPVDLEDQLIHGDLTGNILFSAQLDPLIIDLSPYWHPARFANAIIIVDSIVWEGAQMSLLDEMNDTPDNNQLLIRAALWRIKTTEEYIKQFSQGKLQEVDAYQPFIEKIKKRKYL